MSAEWTNPHTTHLGLAAVMVPFSSCLLFLFVPPSLGLVVLSPFFPSEELFKNLACVCVCVLFCFFYFGASPEPTKDLAITSVVRNLLPAFQYTHKASHVHTSPHTHFAQSLPCFHLPMQTNQKQLHSTYRISYYPNLRAGRA